FTFPSRRSAAHPHLPSFPTRRSSDLTARGSVASASLQVSSWRHFGTVTARGSLSLDRTSEEWKRARCRSGDEIASGEAQERANRSEEHTSELQSLAYLVCRLLLEKKK